MPEFATIGPDVGAALRQGLVIPAHPLALTPERRLDERRQRALSRYYLEAGAGGLAVGVHTTQFEIHDASVGLLRPVLELAAETSRTFASGGRPPVLVAGICGRTAQAVREAELACDLGYHAGLLSLAAFGGEADDVLLAHVRAVGAVLPVFGFYLQPAVGGRRLEHSFWRAFAEIPAVAAIKVAPFNRYATLDVVRAVADSGRAAEIALYTGNDDAIVADLLTPWLAGPGASPLRFVGGLLGHWACWTNSAVRVHRLCRDAVAAGMASADVLALSAMVTDMNAALFDAANGFRGCVAGIHEVLRRQGLLSDVRLLDPDAGLSRGQSAELDRVIARYPHLTDDEFVAENRDRWLS
ncbi:MAG: dihydrodipicolinate synthase family protein [Planctomyces sp.]|nr:dihydrodipicolinate synthase family protein [Planctomyces sp.]